jgi:hypothetical protein
MANISRCGLIEGSPFPFISLVAQQGICYKEGITIYSEVEKLGRTNKTILYKTSKNMEFWIRIPLTL